MTDSADLVLKRTFCGSPAELEHSGDHHGSWFNLGYAGIGTGHRQQMYWMGAFDMPKTAGR